MNGQSFLGFRNRLLSPALIIVLICALSSVLRLMGIGFGLPGTFHADEPHHINIALQFSTFDFNPHLFKYPTLWMYALSVAFGIVFVFWSGFGLLRSVSDFTHLFVWDPTLLYLTARFLAAACGVLAVYGIYRIGRAVFSEETGLTSAALAAVSPPLVYFSHLAKADMAMLLLATLAFGSAAAYRSRPVLRNAVLFGIFAGLSVSTQYTAALIVPLLLWAHALREPGDTTAKFRYLLAGYAAVVLSFLIGTPFSVLDYPAFLRDLRELGEYGSGALAGDSRRIGWDVVKIFGAAMGNYWLWILASIVGFASMAKSNRRTFLFMLGPLIWAGGALALQNRQAGSVNYAFSVIPFALLAAAEGLESFARLRMGRFSPRPLVTLVLLVPLVPTLKSNIGLMAPDTRIEAANWITSQIPEGTALLVDQIHASPPVAMTARQIEALASRLREGGHPRARYYAGMLDSHPGGGYTVYRIQRTPEELISIRTHTSWSQLAYDVVNVEEGLSALKERDIRYVILSSAGATRDNSPRLARFFLGLDTTAEKIAEFPPHRFSRAPTIAIYRLPADHKTGTATR